MAGKWYFGQCVSTYLQAFVCMDKGKFFDAKKLLSKVPKLAELYIQEADMCTYGYVAEDFITSAKLLLEAISIVIMYKEARTLIGRRKLIAAKNKLENLLVFYRNTSFYRLTNLVESTEHLDGYLGRYYSERAKLIADKYADVSKELLEEVSQRCLFYDISCFP